MPPKLQVPLSAKTNGKIRVNISTGSTRLFLQPGNGNNGTQLYVTNKIWLPTANSPREQLENN